jgi:hypothetical protein
MRADPRRILGDRLARQSVAQTALGRSHMRREWILRSSMKLSPAVEASRFEFRTGAKASWDDIPALRLRPETVTRETGSRQRRLQGRQRVAERLRAG